MNENESDWKSLSEELGTINMISDPTPEDHAREDILRARLSEEIRNVNTIRGLKTPEDAAFYVEQGVMSAEGAEFWLEQRRETDAYLDWEFNRRIKELRRAYRERPRRGRERIEEHPVVRELYDMGLELHRENRGMTWPQIAARLGVPYDTWRKWRKRFLKISRENGPKVAP